MNVELVGARVVAVMSELDRELQIVALDGKATDGTGLAETGPVHVRSGRLDGSLPAWITVRAFRGESYRQASGALRTRSDGPWLSRTGRSSPDAKGCDASVRHSDPEEGDLNLPDNAGARQTERGERWTCGRLVAGATLWLTVS